jgi:hypothetical protein
MASAAHSIPAPAQQPGLRSFIVCDKLPEGCLAHLVTDSCAAPHLRPGDIAIIDPDDREPFHGELFLMNRKDGSRWVAATEFFPRPERIVGYDGTTTYWNVIYQNSVFGLDGRSRSTGRWFDGPYREANLLPNLVGKVVGILEPVTEEPKPLALL